MRASPLRLGDTAVVQGAGPIGLLTMQWVRAGGAGRVIVIEPSPLRQELAGSLGADVVVHPDDAGEVITELTSGLGADIVYECVGRPFAIQRAASTTPAGVGRCA